MKIEYVDVCCEYYSQLKSNGEIRKVSGRKCFFDEFMSYELHSIIGTADAAAAATASGPAPLPLRYDQSFFLEICSRRIQFSVDFPN